MFGVDFRIYLILMHTDIHTHVRTYLYAEALVNCSPCMYALGVV